MYRKNVSDTSGNIRYENKNFAKPKTTKNSSVESLYSVYQTQILLIASRYNNVPREDGEFVNNLQYITLV